MFSASKRWLPRSWCRGRIYTSQCSSRSANFHSTIRTRTLLASTGSIIGAAAVGLSSASGTPERKQVEPHADCVAHPLPIFVPPGREEQLRKDLESRKNTHGLDHPDALPLLRELGHILADRGQEDREREYYSDLYLQTISLVGAEHPAETCALAYDFSGLKLNEEWAYAEVLGRLILNQLEDAIKPPDRLTILVKAYLADMYRHQDNYEAADKTIREAFDTSSRQFGVEDACTSECLWRMCNILQEQQKHEEAEKACRLDYETSLRQKGPNHRYVNAAMGRLAENLEALGKFEEARKMYLDVAQHLMETEGPDHPLTVATFNAQFRATFKQVLAKHLEKEEQKAFQKGED